MTLVRVLREDGTLEPGREAGGTGTLWLRMYREMRRVRLLDTRMVALHRQGRIGFYGSAEGQEAIPVATALALDPDDWVVPALREQAVMLARGFPLSRYVAQLFGNAADVLKGRQMPSHHAARSVHQVSWSSCIGTQLPHAVGIAWAMKMKKARSVAIGFCGDGATSGPDFHNAMKFAGVFRVPCVLVCTNNQFAMSVPVSRQTASETLAAKGVAYAIESVRVDGNDALAVHATVTRAVERARGGGGPTFIEALTYRIGAHSTSDDPSKYRSDAEVQAWRARDSIVRLRAYLARESLLTDEGAAALDRDIDLEIAAALRAVEALPPPPRRSLFDDVYARMPWHLREQLDALERVPPAAQQGA